jgi:hypothetical protein
MKEKNIEIKPENSKTPDELLENLCQSLGIETSPNLNKMSELIAGELGYKFNFIVTDIDTLRRQTGPYGIDNIMEMLTDVAREYPEFVSVSVK